jgi:hydrogenase maturation protease
MESSNVQSFVDKLRELVSRGAVLVFLGNEIRGDDAAGILIGRRLAERFGESRNIFVCEMGLEVCSVDLRSLNPRIVVLVDAVMAPGLEPGDIVLAPAESEEVYTPLSTHAIPKTLILKSLGVEEAWILGVQVQSIGIGDEMTPRVREAVEKLTSILETVLREAGSETKA